MNLLFCLESILTDFRHLFNKQNFSLFKALIFGFIGNTGSGTLTNLYQSSGSERRYWSFVKFLSRGNWDADAVATLLLKRLQQHFAAWVYVYDTTKALKTGKSQWGLHFFRNFSYQKHRVNQSKFQHEFGALGVLCSTATERLLFPVWVKLISPQTIRDKSDAVLKRIFSKIARGLIIFDRGFSRRKVFTMLLELGHHILCRAKSNAVFYHLPKPAKRRGRGRPKKYGDRLAIRRLRYNVIDRAGQTDSIASKVVGCVFTTDLTLEIPKIVEYYRQRWQICQAALWL